MVESTVARAVPHAVQDVRRPRLERLLDDERRRPVTLVCAPPGAGKTTLLAAWHGGLVPGRATWVTAGAGEDDLEDLLQRLAQLREHILIVDDAHQLNGPALDALVRLVETAPSGLDVVIAARADPPLGLGRLRLESRLGEVRGAALAFTVEEAQELFRSHSLNLRVSDVRRLHGRTEGWVAGLRLIACALERGASASRLAEDDTATPAAVSDYLFSEVLDRESPERRHFLLRTSIAEQLTPELAVLLAGDPTGGAVLEDLHRRGVFVTALDHGWYRYHSLFASLLRAQLRVSDPGLAGELHRRAATWFADRDLRTAAEMHARAGEDWALLGALLRRRWRDATLSGEPGVRLAAGLPPSAFHADALALVAAAENADAALPADPSGQLQDELAIVARRRVCASGRGEEDIEPHRCRDTALRPIVDLLDAELRLAAGDVDGAIALASGLSDSNGSWVEVDARGLLAVALALTGRVEPATRLVAQLSARREVRIQRGRLAPNAAIVATAICESLLGRYIDTLQLAPATSDDRSAALRTCARALIAAGGATGGAIAGVDPALARNALASKVFIAVGVLDVVDATGARTEIGGAAEAALRRGRHSLATGSPRAALSGATDAIPRALHPRTLVEATVLVAAAAAAIGEEDRANEAILAAVDLATETRIWAPLIVHASEVTALLERVATAPGPGQIPAIEALELMRREANGAIVEPLTAREITVLNFLPTLMSNDEIADAMHLSVNTVKTHLKSLYRKLGVDRRRAAVVHARELELL